MLVIDPRLAAPRLLEVREVAQYLSVSEESVRRQIRLERLKAFQVGIRDWRIKKSDLDAYEELCLAESQAVLRKRRLASSSRTSEGPRSIA